MSPLEFARRPRAHRRTSPDLRYPRSRPGRASPRALGVTLVTQREPSCCWQLKTSRVFNQEPEDLGTRQQLHLPRRSQSPPFCNSERYPCRPVVSTLLPTWRRLVKTLSTLRLDRPASRSFARHA